MDFNSPIFFLLFLPVFFILYYPAPKPLRIYVGIIGGLLFYSWGYAAYLPLILGITLLAFLLGLGIERWRGHGAASLLLWGGVLVNIALIVVFKLSEDLSYPLGLSFLTFQVIAYLVEVNNKAGEAERNLLDFSFYLLLFPKLPAGPITRYRDLRRQIKDIRIEPHDAADGLRRFITGFAKKALIADTLGKVASPVFDLSSPGISPALAWLALVSFALQLYFDFSGYSDMAIGLGRMMGFRFVENFNFPYISKNIGDFWRRWHISLSTWFRDMVFYPLERRRLAFLGQQVNILTVFLLTGLWHGLTLNFVIWGLIHGAALVFEATAPGRRLRGAWAPIQHLYALGVILLGWVFFASPTPAFAIDFLQRLLGDTRGLEPLPFELTNPLPFIEPTFLLALFLSMLLSMPVSGWMGNFFRDLTGGKLALNAALRIAADLGLVFLFFASVAAVASAEFIPAIYGNF
ncbi:MAG: hypothetical protein DPW18_15955 [Chloroflexi bacterium]|nr:hypothetical protein [Chloroflexota bacterium]MDL1940777.1 MBOAT family protein [Chloroflexi bacterium CFX2]